EKPRDKYQGTELGRTMESLHRDIAQDRDALEELMAHLEGERHPVKEAAGWALGEVGRVRRHPTARAAPRPAPRPGAAPGPGRAGLVLGLKAGPHSRPPRPAAPASRSS